VLLPCALHVLLLRHRRFLGAGSTLANRLIFGVQLKEPQDIPTKGRMPVRSAFFGRNEITRRCYDLLREKGTIAADDVTVRAMREKGLDPEADRKQRTDFTRRIRPGLR
jgi:hypothetical protein